jgi:histidine triad (HIT) family protein
MACIVCEKIREKKAIIVYEDDSLIAVLPNKPAVPGHIKIYPKSHCTKLDEMTDGQVEHFFMMANYASSAAFDALHAQGTNILINESQEHLVLDVVPRKENDGISFAWKSKQPTQEELDDMYARVKEKAFIVGKKEVSLPVVEQGMAAEKIKDTDVEDSGKGSKDAMLIPAKKERPDESDDMPKNYMIRNLIRIP